LEPACQLLFCALLLVSTDVNTTAAKVAGRNTLSKNKTAKAYWHNLTAAQRRMLQEEVFAAKSFERVREALQST